MTNTTPAILAPHRAYPRTIAHAVGAIELTLLDPDRDGAAVLAFAQGLPEHDLLFLRRDIAQPKVVDAWMQATRVGSIVTVLARRGGIVVGCATLVRDALAWSAHVAEMRVIVDPALRGSGLGQQLAHECFAIAVELGVEKVTAQMTVDQRGAVEMFEGLGFRPEALLKDQVKDRAGRTHDIVMLSQDVARFLSQQAAYGLGEVPAD
jgi:N-acetylglutamate synthase-like GNAT family acetyltransferase